MLSKFSFWIKGTIFLQLLTALFHSSSFFVEPQPANDTEKQLMELSRTYKPDAGLGFNPSFKDLFTGLSLGFTLIFVFAALLNWFLLKRKPEAGLWKGVLLIETIIFGFLFLAMLVFTFAPPIICTGLVFLFAGASCLTVKNK